MNGTSEVLKPSGPPTPEERIAAIEARRQKRQENADAAKQAQYATDLEAFEALEQEHGAAIAMLHVPHFVEGLPTFLVVKSPGGTSYYNRYKDQVRKAGKNAQMIGQAQEMLGASSIIYPVDEDLRKRMYAEFPGATLSAGVRAVKFVELEEEDEKKG